MQVQCLCRYIWWVKVIVPLSGGRGRRRGATLFQLLPACNLSDAEQRSQDNVPHSTYRLGGCGCESEPRSSDI